MSNQTIKIYNSNDFERITKGIKLAHCMQVKSPDASINTDKSDSYVTSGTLSCSYCNTIFENKIEQRLHYKLDWHRYNLKQQLDGLKPISEHDFNILTEKDGCCSSESKFSVDSSSPSKKVANKNNKSKELTLETRINDVSPEKSYEHSAENVETETNTVFTTTSRRSKILFENQDGNFFSIYHCLLLHKKKSIAEVDHDTIVDALTKKDKSLWTIIMVGCGHFAGAVFSDGEAVIHKTLHAYTVRAKQGSAQHSRDNRYSAHCKSAGANLRRANELHFSQKVQQIIKSWSSYLTNSSLILYRAVGPHNRSILFGGKDTPLDKTDIRLRPLPFPTCKPTFKEICRIYDLLNTVEIYNSATSYVNNCLAKRLSSQVKKIRSDSPTNSKLADDLTNQEFKDETQPKETLTESQLPSSERKKNARTRMQVIKPMKSQKRLLPDIVAKLADISLESEVDLFEDVDDIQELMASSMTIDLKDCLQEFDNTPVPKSKSKAKKHLKSSPRTSNKN